MELTRSTSPEKAKKDAEPKPYVAGRVVYIGLRRYDTTRRKAVNCRGLNIRAFDFTPEEVHVIIRRALEAAAAEYQALERARKLVNDGNGNEG